MIKQGNRHLFFVCLAVIILDILAGILVSPFWFFPAGVFIIIYFLLRE